MPNTSETKMRHPCRQVPTSPPDLPAVEELRTRALLGRVRSEPLAAVIGALAFAVPERRI